jgi:hypothetical protein
MPLQAVQILPGKPNDTANVFEPVFLHLERHKSVIRRVEWQPQSPVTCSPEPKSRVVHRIAHDGNRLKSELLRFPQPGLDQPAAYPSQLEVRMDCERG